LISDNLEGTGDGIQLSGIAFTTCTCRQYNRCRSTEKLNEPDMKKLFGETMSSTSLYGNISGQICELLLMLHDHGHDRIVDITLKQ